MTNKNHIKLLVASVGFLLLAAIYTYWNNSFRSYVEVMPPAPDKQIEQPRLENAIRTASQYEELLNKYENGSIRHEPVAIDQLIDLTGACESVAKLRPGVEVSEEVKRMQRFCNMHFSDTAEISYQLNELWPQSYSQKLAGRFRELEEKDGKDAVKRELSVELRTGDAYQVQIALEYAANAGIVPEEIGPVIDDTSSGSISNQLSILSHIEFCNRGGACGGRDFATLSACVAMAPCAPNVGLLEVIRRASAPRDYEMALRMSQALHRRR